MSIDAAKAKKAAHAIRSALSKDGWDCYIVQSSEQTKGLAITNSEVAVTVLPTEVQTFVEKVLKRNGLSTDCYTFRAQ